MSETNNNDVIHLGILGAANSARSVVIQPLTVQNFRIPSDPPACFGIRLYSVASRDPARAQRYASEHKIPNIHPTYAALIADPNIHAVLIPLPNNLHFEWILKSVEAGKHVLCETPFVSNAEQAQKVIDVVRKVNAAREKEGKPPIVVMEAQHWRFHPALGRVREIISSGVLGRLIHTEVELLVPLSLPISKAWDDRQTFELAGGCLMAGGCYVLNALRMLSGDLKPRVVSARATKHRNDPRVDKAMFAELEYGNGVKSTVNIDFESSSDLGRIARLSAYGDKGELHLDEFLAPHSWNKLYISMYTNPTDAPEVLSWLEKTGKDVVEEEHYADFEGRRATTFWYQLRAFERLVRRELREEDHFQVGLTSLEVSSTMMEVLDDIYRAAGMEIRP
ncbi:hypothetical protein HK102_001049 [Quaeritorhiza haematococci]|nr:hypothetical protein HK102_001049 [Quaeritorhiza haematococci]